jgi:GDPmannose 4,6-dehydratase
MRALITGVSGQDGGHLAKFLLSKGYEVYGMYRRLSSQNFWRLQYLGIFDKVHLIPADLSDSSSLIAAINASKPDEIYHLAAQSLVGASFEQPIATGEITGLGVERMLEAVRQVDSNIKFYNAATSELFGNRLDDKQPEFIDESARFCPVSPYANAKLYGYWSTKIYRDAYGIFACNGILFNHEGILRGLDFVTRKISNAVAKIVLGIDSELKLGNMTPKRDWGYSPEFCEAMWLMLQHKPDDYVIATGESHSVQEFVEEAFKIANLDWRNYVHTEQKLLRPIDVVSLRGNSAKAKEKLGWQPKVKFKQLVEIMVKEDMTRWERWQRGERFPWDAPVSAGDSYIFSRAIDR